MRYISFILTVLASVGFFNYHGIISDQMMKLAFYLSVMLCMFTALKEGCSLSKVKFPRWAYACLMGGIAFSCVMATAFQQQGLLMSVMTTLPYFFAYMLLYCFMKFNMKYDKVMQIYIVICSVSAIVFFINLASMPNNIFGKPILNEDLSRGIVRVPVNFIRIFSLLLFFSINNILLSIGKKWKWWTIIAVCTLVIFLSVIRQLIAITGVLGFWFLFRKVSVGKKIAVVAAMLLVVAVVLPQIPMYKTMIELSEDQKDDDEENIRVTAWRFYTYEYQTNALTPIFGNGMPSFGNSAWGRIVESDMDVTGCFAADVGWAGFYWHFGIIATVGLAALLVCALMKRKPPQYQYLNYWIILIILTGIASGPYLYYYEIIDLAMVLALAYMSPTPDPNTSNLISDTTDELNSTDNTQLQQRKRYPQLR